VTTYLLVGILWAVNSNDLGGSFVSLVAVLDEFLLERGVVLDISRLIDATLDVSSS